MQHCDGLINVRLTLGCRKCHFLLAALGLSWVLAQSNVWAVGGQSTQSVLPEDPAAVLQCLLLLFPTPCGSTDILFSSFSTLAVSQ